FPLAGSTVRRCPSAVPIYNKCLYRKGAVLAGELNATFLSSAPDFALRMWTTWSCDTKATMVPSVAAGLGMSQLGSGAASVNFQFSFPVLVFTESHTSRRV